MCYYFFSFFISLKEWVGKLFHVKREKGGEHLSKLFYGFSLNLINYFPINFYQTHA